MFPLVESPLGGIVGATTASIFMLDPVTNMIPIEPVLDLVPGYSPLRVTMDMVDSESISMDYEITDHPVQDMLDITSNIKKKMKGATITGTLAATPPLIPFSLGAVGPVIGSVTRLDLIRMRFLEQIADQRRPVMVVTPRFGIAQAGIMSIRQNWTPAIGESTSLTIVVKQIRLVSPLYGDLITPDYPPMPPGNNAATAGGTSATAAAGETATASTTTGVPPTVGS